MSPELKELLSDVSRLNQTGHGLSVDSLAYRARKILRAEEDRYTCWRDLFNEEHVNAEKDWELDRKVTTPISYIRRLTDEPEEGWLGADGVLNPYPESKQEAL